MRKFPTADVLAVYHGRHTGDFDAMRECLDFIVGAHVPLWDIPRARRIARKALKTQYPGLDYAGPDPDQRGDAPSINKWVKRARKQVGADELAVKPAGRGGYKVRTLSAALR